MSVRLRFGAILIALLALGACSSTRQPAAAQELSDQTVSVDLRAWDGTATLHVFSFGESYVIDATKLTFTARLHAGPQGRSRAVDATIGLPVIVPPVTTNASGQQGTQYSMTVAFGNSPGPSGMYDLEAHFAPGFARTRSGEDMSAGMNTESIWWPDLRRGDAVLARAQALVGRDIYGYAGLEIGCANWNNAYSSATPVRVTAVNRELGGAGEFWTGRTTSWGNDAALHFFVVDPLRIVVEKPASAPVAYGGNSGPGTTETCPATELADWQLDVTFATTPPPSPPIRPKGAGPVWLGMSRDAVIWSLGYPNEFGDRATLLAQSVWSYDDGPGDAFTVTFRNDRVSGFTTQIGLP